MSRAGANERGDPRVFARAVRTHLAVERVPDLYREGMTMKEAKDAVRCDPRVHSRCLAAGRRHLSGTS